MTGEIEDFWPDLNPTAVTTPALILKTQAAFLSTKTSGLLQGEIETWTMGNWIYHRLLIVVPALDNYRYSLLRVHHSPTLYPVWVDDSPIPEFEGGLTSELQDEASFREWLRTTFQAKQTKTVLESLLAQASS